MAEIQKFLTPVFRMSFPNLFEPSAMDAESKPKYGLSAVWTVAKFSDKDKERWRALIGALDAESKAKFKKAWKDLPGNFKTGIRDGAEKANLEGFGEGTKFANITTKMRPGIVDVNKRHIARDGAEKEKWEADGKDVAEEVGDEAIYPGCYCRATVTVYSYDNKGKGVALGLMNVQKVADGPRLDARTNAAEDFEDDVDSQWLEMDEGGDGAPDPLDDI